jgi:hypothetical protein
MTETIQSGDTIAVDYTGKYEDGKIFDTSEGKAPLTFTVGTGMLIKGSPFRRKRGMARETKRLLWMFPGCISQKRFP